MTAHSRARRTSLLARAAATVLASLLVVVGLGVAPASALETDPAKFEDRILQLLNADRRAKGLGTLKRVVEIDTVARNWSKQMVRESSMYHNPRYLDQIPSGWWRAGENVAMGHQTPDEMYRGWYNSPGHYRNMFNAEFTHIGIGIAYENARGWVAPYGTQVFGGYDSSARLTTTPRPAAKPAPTPVAIPSDNGSTTSTIDDGGVGGAGNEYHLANGYTGSPNYVFAYGNRGGRVYVGDWDGDGTDTLAYRIGNTFYIRGSNSAGNASQVVSYGKAGDRVYVGDWNGDGRDTLAVRRGKTYHVKNSVTGGDADHVISYGRTGDDVLVGDWNGDGRDTFTVRRGKTYFVKNRIAGGDADMVITYGRANDDVYVGDWDGDGRDSFTVRRARTYYVKNSISGGDADRVLQYGRADDTTLVGDWDGNGRDSLGIRR